MKAFQKTAVMLVAMVIASIMGITIMYAPLMEGLRTGAGWCTFLSLVIVSLVVGLVDTERG